MIQRQGLLINFCQQRRASEGLVRAVQRETLVAAVIPRASRICVDDRHADSGLQGALLGLYCLQEFGRIQRVGSDGGNGGKDDGNQDCRAG